MKRYIGTIIAVIILILTIVYINPITDKISSYFSFTPSLVIKQTKEYTKNQDYLFVQRTDSFIPYSYQDLLNIYYTAVDNGWEQFTFYCPKEYKNCINDVIRLSDDKVTLSHLNNYVHPFNSFTDLKSSISKSGEITFKVMHLYTEDEIKKINEKVDEIIKSEIKEDSDDRIKILTIHDYIANNTKYDVERNDTGNSPYLSYKAYGPLFEGFATCHGYTDLLAIFLTKMGYDNYKIATTPETENEKGHIWNAVKYYNEKEKTWEWLHIDLTWDDPVSKDNKDYLFHTYFLVDNEKMKTADGGKVVLDDHNFNKLYYLEFNN